MPEPRQMLTRPGGPVVIAAKTLRAILAIKRDKLVPELYGQTVISQSNWDALLASPEGQAWREVVRPAGDGPGGPGGQPPGWLFIGDDRPEHPLPERLAGYALTRADPLGIATLQLALVFPASLVLIDGPIKEKAKLSFIKCEGVVSILVQAYREGRLSAVEPMIKALTALGHADVLPRPEALAAMREALGKLE